MTLLGSPILAAAGFRHGFPTRTAPDAELLGALGAGRILQVKQVHGARAILASEAAGQEADALVGRAGGEGIAVGVRVADCVPVLVASVATGDVAAIHAGWRGLVGGVVEAGVELLGKGARASSTGPLRAFELVGDLIAVIGPCIGACCFEVGRDVGERIGFVVREQGDKQYVDLRAAVRARLVALGVGTVDDVPGCTRHEPERFHSFRRDGANSGRMLAAIATRAR